MSAIRTDALRLLGRRDYTTAELTRRLLDRGFSPEEIRETISALTKEGALDDRRVAAAHIRTSTRIKRRGRERIRRELQARGIGSDVIRDLLAEVSADDERDTLEAFLRRRRLPDPLPPDDRRRVIQQLVRRGFALDLIVKVLEGRDEE